MVNPADARNEQIKELRKNRSNIYGQDKVENDFYKPMMKSS
jgi:hypothetical protein